MRLRYDGPGHVLKAFGKTLERGAEDEFTASEARTLLAHQAIRVTPIEVERPARTGAGSGRDAWVIYAAERGIPTDGLTRDEIVAAVDAADTADDTPPEGDTPEAPNTGEGQTQPDEQEE